jgi:hypothetical protein
MEFLRDAERPLPTQRPRSIFRWNPPEARENRGLSGMRFTIDAVTQWIVQRYRDQIGQRGLSAAVGTTFFSLLQSLLYEYPDKWLRVIEALTFVKKSVATELQ